MKPKWRIKDFADLNLFQQLPFWFKISTTDLETLLNKVFLWGVTFKLARPEALKFYSNTTTTTSTPPAAIKFRLKFYTAEREIIYFRYLYSSFGSSEHCGMISFLNYQDLIFPPNREKHGSNGITELQRFQFHHHRYVNVSKANPQTLNFALFYALWKADVISGEWNLPPHLCWEPRR